MKILMVTSETVPFAKTGGLADAVSALAINLRKQGHDVRIVMPRYYKIDRTKLKPIENRILLCMQFHYRNFKDVAIREIGEGILIKYLKEE